MYATLSLATIEQTKVTTDLGLIGDSPLLQVVRDQIGLYADLNFPLLIEGESGTGKELVAAALKQLSNCPDHAFKAINCAAIPDSLIESTLFGHSKGAFTSASAAHIGLFEDEGVKLLFLDEIGELPLVVQAKLLRVLENGEFQRVGDNVTRKSTVRVIAATNRNLFQAVKAGDFRSDLFHRLNVLSIKTVPLRRLGKDKFLLLEHFNQRWTNETGRPAFTLQTDAMHYWDKYSFPGNVRELRNLVIRLNARYSGKTINCVQLQAEFEPFDLPNVMHDEGFFENIRQQLQQGKFDLNEQLRQQESFYFAAAMGLAEGNISKAAELLGIKRTTLHSRLSKQHGELQNN